MEKDRILSQQVFVTPYILNVPALTTVQRNRT